MSPFWHGFWYALGSVWHLNSGGGKTEMKKDDQGEICEAEGVIFSVRGENLVVEIRCKSQYMARVLFEDIRDRVKRGQKVVLEPMGEDLD